MGLATLKIFLPSQHADTKNNAQGRSRWAVAQRYSVRHHLLREWATELGARPLMGNLRSDSAGAMVGSA